MVLDGFSNFVQVIGRAVSPPHFRVVEVAAGVQVAVIGVQALFFFDLDFEEVFSLSLLWAFFGLQIVVHLICVEVSVGVAKVAIKLILDDADQGIS